MTSWWSVLVVVALSYVKVGLPHVRLLLRNMLAVGWRSLMVCKRRHGLLMISHGSLRLLLLMQVVVLLLLLVRWVVMMLWLLVGWLVMLLLLLFAVVTLVLAVELLR